MVQLSCAIWASIRRAMKPLLGGFGAKANCDGQKEAIMLTNKGWTRQESARVLDELAASIEAAESAEIATDFREAGHDLRELENRIKTAALAGIEKFKQQSLGRDRERHSGTSPESLRVQILTASDADRRRVCSKVIESDPLLRPSVQYDDLDKMTEEDPQAALEAEDR